MNKLMFWTGLFMIGLEALGIEKGFLDYWQGDIAKLIFYICLVIFNLAGIVFIFAGLFFENKRVEI